MALGSFSVSMSDTGANQAIGSNQTAVQLGEFSEDVKLRSVVVTANATGTLEAKAVVYQAGVKIADGTVVTQSVTAGEQVELPFSAAVSLTALTDYKIGVYAVSGGAASPRVQAGTATHTHSSTPAFCDWVELNGSIHYGAGDTEPTSTLGYELAVDLTFDSPSITVTLAPAVETDTAPAFGRTKRKAIATVTETDTAPAVARRKSKALATATETDEVVAITATTTGIRVAVATVTETDEAPAITRTDPATFLYRLTFPTYPRSFQTVPIGRTVRFVLDQAVSIVRINGTLRQFRSPSQTQLEAAGTEGVDWFIGGRIYDQISNDTAIELRLAGFETERVT